MRILGLILIASPLAVLYVWLGRSDGFVYVSKIFGIVLGMVLVVSLGAYLLTR